MPAQTIDEVIALLDEVIHRARQESDRLGYFATLYRNVTLKIKEGIAADLFEDGIRMERLDVTFANRYLAALDSFRRGQQPSKCWRKAFDIAAAWPPIVLQHLLVGMNAHINFDLGIAVQEVAPGDALPSLRKDFDQVNNILASMVIKVRSDIEQVSPWIKFLDQFDPKGQDRFIDFSFSKARASAWLVATMINSTPPDHLARKMHILDGGVSMLGSIVAHPRSLLARMGLRVIRLRESNDVQHVIDVLSQV